MKDFENMNNALKRMKALKERVIEILYWTECKAGKDRADGMLGMFVKDLIKKYTMKKGLNKAYAIGLIELIKDLAMEREER